MSKGIIISVDYGFGMKYDDEDEFYLMLEIKQTNNWQCCQYFHNDNIRKVLEHFNEKKINKLLYKTVELGEMPNSTLNPNRIRYTLADDWLYNDNFIYINHHGCVLFNNKENPKDKLKRRR